MESNPNSGNQDEEYFTLVNTNKVSIDISHWQIRGAIDLTFQGRRFNTLIKSYERQTPCHPIETVVDILLCRDPAQTLLSRLTPGSVVVIGKRTRWWPKPEDWLARKLRQANHHVVRVTNHKETKCLTSSTS